jgi:DNA replication protein DnaC
MAGKKQPKTEKTTNTTVVESSAKDDKIVNDVLKNAKVPAASIQKAIDENQKRKEEANTEKILDILEKFDTETANCVTALKKARRIEAQAKKALVNISKTKELFVTTGNPSETKKFMRENSVYCFPILERLGELED